MINERTATGGGWRVRGREAAAAGLVYVLFLGLAVASSYGRGPGLLRSVIWDPVTLYTFYPGDQVVIKDLEAGYFPLWDSSRGLGVPHVIPAGASYDNPLKLVGILLNSAAGWELYFLARFLCAGLFCFLAAREVGLRFRGALFAGLSFMLCGYFREYHNQVSMNVEVLFPLFFFFNARMARRPTLTNLIGFLIIGINLTSNPESTAYALILSAGFFLFRGLTLLPGAVNRSRAALALIILPLMFFPHGFFIRADSMLGFIEYHHNSWIFHAKGLGGLAMPVASAIGLVTPLFDYWLASPVNLEQAELEQLTLVPAYFGAVTFILAGIALVHLRKLSSAGLFFAATTLVLTGMLFGAPPFSLLTQLPLIRFFQNFRYSQPYLAFAIAMLAGMGLEIALAKKIRLGTSAAVAGLTGLWVAVHLVIFREQIAATALIQTGLLAAAVIAIILAGGAVLLWRRFPARRGAVIAGLLIAANGLELALYFNLAMPVFGPEAYSIEEPPGARFVAERDRGVFRIFGTDQRILHPNLAGMSGLADLRDHTPLEVGDYARFMSAANGWNTPELMISNFLRGGKFYFDVEWESWPPALLDLVNVRYVLGYDDPDTRPLVPAGSGVSALTRERRYVSSGDLAVAGVVRTGTITHAPARVEAPLVSAPGGRAVMEAAVLDSATRCADTDGVTLAALLRTGRGNRLIYARTARVDRDPGWKPMETDLTGDEYALAITALPGPKNDERCDFGAWSRPRLEPAQTRDPVGPGLVKIYDREFRIYENPNVLPRVFSVTEIVQQPDRFAFIEQLKGQDPGRKAWVENLEGLTTASFAPAAISDIAEGPGRLTFRSRSASPSFVVISNLFFPGWRAYTDGHEVRVRRVDGLLQGLELPAGDREVVMVYTPASFRVGIWVHVVGMVMMALMLALAFVIRGRYYPKNNHERTS